MGETGFLETSVRWRGVTPPSIEIGVGGHFTSAFNEEWWEGKFSSDELIKYIYIISTLLAREKKSLGPAARSLFVNLKIKVSWHRFQRWRQYLALSFQRVRESERKKDEARQG